MLDMVFTFTSILDLSPFFVSANFNFHPRQKTVMNSSYVVPATDEEVGRTKVMVEQKLNSDGSMVKEINGKIHRTLTTKSSVQEMSEKIENEGCCKRSWFDLWDILCFFLVKIFPCFKSLPCFVSCRKNSDGEYQHMQTVIEGAHTGLPVSYDDFTNLMNTILLMSALFLSFVAGSVTVLGEEQFTKQDLTACQRGWAHGQICKKLDVAGYFGDINATWLLTESDLPTYLSLNNSSSHRRLKIVARGEGGGVSSSEYVKYTSVDIGGMWLGTWWESPQLTSGNELPSYAILFYSAWSFGLLILVVVSGFVHYFILILTGARQDESIMKTFWEASVTLVIIDLGAIITALIFWLQAMGRIVGCLWPSYNLHGIEFLWFTHSDTDANYGVLFSAFCNEGIVAWGFIMLWGFFGYIIIRTFEAELNYLTQDRPKHIAGFVMKAFEHLEDDDCLPNVVQLTDDSQSVALGAIQGDGKTSAVYRVVDIFKSEGYKVGGEEWTEEQEKEPHHAYTATELREGVDKDGNKLLSTAAKEKAIAIKEMEHFIDEFGHFDWTELSRDRDGNKILSFRERACLLRLHSELYTSD
jgi:hypothetical protein